MNFSKKYVGTQYTTRDERNEFIVNELSKYIGSSVLNVGGGGQKYMKKYLNNDIKYFELDIAGTPDIKINLEKELPIPADSNSYDTVVCTDVLEHLDNFHDVFEELLRISNKYVIISLPNCTSEVLTYFRDNYYHGSEYEFGKYMKFYGLPLEKPEDRHKWFFSYVEAEEFFKYKSKKLGFNIAEMFPIGYYAKNNSFKSNVLRSVLNVIGSENTKKNLFSSAFWIVIEK